MTDSDIEYGGWKEFKWVSEWMVWFGSISEILLGVSLYACGVLFIAYAPAIEAEIGFNTTFFGIGLALMGGYLVVDNIQYIYGYYDLLENERDQFT